MNKVGSFWGHGEGELFWRKATASHEGRKGSLGIRRMKEKTRAQKPELRLFTHFKLAARAKV
jgi:hypothetical protein